MREASRDKGRLVHMVDAIDHVLAYTDGLTLEQLGKIISVSMQQHTMFK